METVDEVAEAEKVEKFDEAMAVVAMRQHAVITLKDVRAAGGKGHHAVARVKAGRWIELYEGVYRLAGAPWTYHGQVLAAVRAAGDDAAASFFCAARLLGLGFARATIEISVPRARFFRPKGITVHTSRDLDRCTIVEVDGIPVTDAARTLLDIMSKLKSPTTRRKTVEAARRANRVDWHELVVCLAAHARKGRRGISRLREVIAQGARNNGITETDSELVALTLIREHDFPEPVLQHEVRDDDGELVAQMDFAYLESKKNIEIDGSVHLRPEVKQKDEARDFVLREYYGWTVRRVWWEIPVYQPRKFIESVRQTIGQPANGDATGRSCS